MSKLDTNVRSNKFTVRLSDEELHWLDRLSTLDGVSKADWLRKRLDEEIEKAALKAASGHTSSCDGRKFGDHLVDGPFCLDPATVPVIRRILGGASVVMPDGRVLKPDKAARLDVAAKALSEFIGVKVWTCRRALEGVMPIYMNGIVEVASFKADFG